MNLLSDSLTQFLACPNCKNALQEHISAGFAWSIGLMMLVPMAIIMFWGSAIFLAIRRQHSGEPSEI